MRYSLLFIFLSTLSPLAVVAQLRADFSQDKQGGCSPVSISFTNTSTGASPGAMYHWDFGNGNSSVLENAGAVYYEEKVYTVTLTVKDGTQASKQTKTITVYKKPAIDFTFTPDNGCLPMTVNFTSSSAAGDGNIAAYHWDFGDGTAVQSTAQSMGHTYNFQQKATVSLTAVNNYGCSKTLTKDSIITVHPALTAGFNADKAIHCDAPAVVKFNNTSSGPGTLSYLWDFGDGGSSTAMSPSHTYTKKGTYPVKLIVQSSEGCTVVSVRNDYINIADFSTDIQVPSLICTNTRVVFTSSSSPAPNQVTWRVDGVEVYYYGLNYLEYTFTTPGNHTVELINNFGNCQQTIIKRIEVKPQPALTGFVVDIKGLCGAPVKVDFRDTTAGAVNWQWNFNYYADYSAVHATVPAPSHTYQADNWYYTSLTVKNADGCSAAITKQIAISRPLVYILVPDGISYQGCAPYTTQFEYRSTEPLTSFQWNFGDGSRSNEISPTHTFVQPGQYAVSFTYTMANGCTGTVSFSQPVEAIQKPVPNFEVQSIVCGNTPVTFFNTSTGPYSYAHWDFGDNTGWQYNTNTHQYQDEGEYTVKLMLSSFFNTCRDTIIKTAIVKVVPPFAKIAGHQNSCEATRGEVTFFDGSRQVTGWHWDFGDGTTESYNTARTNIAHLYKTSGTYKVVLTVTNAGCSVKDSTNVYVLLKKPPLLTFDATSVCVNGSAKFTISGLDLNPHQYFTYWHPYDVMALIYEDGSELQGILGYDGSTGTSITGTLLYPTQIKKGRIRAVIRSTVFDCTDTSNYVALEVIGSQASFGVVSPDVCFKSPALFKDESVASPGVSITKWNWDFGDGTFETNAKGGTVAHQYHSPGLYYVSLTTTDANGCSAYSGYYTQSVNVTGPGAAFTTSTGNTVQLNSTVNFYNNTNTAHTNAVTYLWNFGNGITSTSYSPSYTYTVPGEYIVTLVAEYAQSQCRDTARQTITVKNFNTGFTTNTLFIGNHGACLPVRANFVNTSSNYTRLVWDFGDGFTLENQAYPSHMYYKPGKYIITLDVYGYNGLTGTYKDTVFVNSPTAAINVDDLEGCIGNNVLLNAPTHNNASTYLWDFGNGYMVNSRDSFSHHAYMAAGIYTPSLIVKDVNGCSAAIKLQDEIVIHQNPVITISPLSPLVCKTNGVQLQASGAILYEWSPAAGLSNTAIASPLALPAETTTYSVAATDEKGCTGLAATTVIVLKPFAMSVSSDAEICKGSSVQLNATGAESYQWINTTTGLNTTHVGNPTTTPLTTTRYTVVGYDQYQCYSDTSEVTVIVRPLPTVNAGPDIDAVFGSENILATTNSSDVVRWNWTPGQFLNCTNCPSPVSKPHSPMEYIVEVHNNYNCSAKDTIIIKATCTADGIYIPSAFTPNRDGKNDRFTINGTGVGIIRSLRIYNRWGEIIFNKKNFYPNDNSSAWDGRYKGVDAPAGAYVYFAEMECNAGEKFARKGTVTLIR
jgi:gliding motility-associated-like protein